MSNDAPAISIVGCSNWNNRAKGTEVSLIVLHADGDARAADAIRFCTDPHAERKVSYHEIIERDAHVTRLVALMCRAWHAGVSAFNGEHVGHSVNDFSIGLCLSNRQDGAEPFTDAALDRAADRCVSYMRQYPAITLERIATHAMVALPAGRKVDPAPGGPFDFDDFLQRVERRLGDPIPALAEVP